MVVSSPGTPQENRKAKRKVRQVLELARAMMLGAPHLPTSAWGSAVLYTEHVNEVIPKGERYNYMTPYEMNRGRAPDMLRVFIRTFGCYVQWSSHGEGEKPDHKMNEKTHDGCFIGIEYPSALILDTSWHSFSQTTSSILRIQK